MNIQVQDQICSKQDLYQVQFWIFMIVNTKKVYNELKKNTMIWMILIESKPYFKTKD